MNLFDDLSDDDSNTKTAAEKKAILDKQKSTKALVDRPST